jgi:hypothetical protein
MTAAGSLAEEVKRIRRVADAQCTGHANLRDRYARRALLLDLAILALSLWLVALAFVENRITIRLTPFGWDSQLWMGVLAVFTFLLTIVQLKTDWKGRADAHRRTLDIYAEVKREAGYLIASNNFGEEECRRVLARYDMASAVGIAIPEADFLAQKRRHLTKVALSKHLDAHPSASLAFFRLRLWVRDNFGRDRNAT